MKSHLFRYLSVFLFSYCVIASSQASLIDFGNGMIYDDDINLTLLKDMNYSMTSGYDKDGLMGWQEALIWADQLNFGGFDDWRLPSVAPCFDNQTLCPGLGELGHIYYEELGGSLDSIPEGIPLEILSIFDNVQNGSYWAGPEYDCCNFGESTHAWWYSLLMGAQDTSPILGDKYVEYAWVVRDGSPVPVPGAIWLFATGLLGMIGIARFRIKTAQKLYETNSNY